MLGWPSSVRRTPLIRTVARCSKGFPDLPSVPSSCLQDIRHRPKERSKHRVIERSAALSYGAASAGLLTAELKPTQTGRRSGRLSGSAPGGFETFAVVCRIRSPGPAPPDDGQIGTNLRRIPYGIEYRDRTEIKAAASNLEKRALLAARDTHPAGLTRRCSRVAKGIRDRKPVTRIPRGSLDNAIASLREIAGGNSSAVEVRQSCTVGRLHCSRATEIRARRKPWSVDYPRPRFRRRKWGRFDRVVTLRLRSPRRHG